MPHTKKKSSRAKTTARIVVPVSRKRFRSAAEKSKKRRKSEKTFHVKAGPDWIKALRRIRAETSREGFSVSSFSVTVTNRLPLSSAGTEDKGVRQARYVSDGEQAGG